MSSAPREAMVPLTRWQYFTKTLYHNAAAKTRFVYNKVVYEKDETLQKIEEGNGRINMGLLLVLLAMFLTASTVQNIYIIVAGMVVIAAGELARLLRLPKDITAHLTTRACGSADYGGHHTDRTHRDALCREVRRAAAERRGRLLRTHCVCAGVPRSCGAAGTGGILPYLADLAV